MNQIIFGDNLEVLPTLPKNSVSLIYIDPPFNTGKVQKRVRMRNIRDEHGDRQGFGGRRYSSEVLESPEYTDSFVDFESFLIPRIDASLACLTQTGSLFVHVDYREVHYVKVALDRLLGRDHFMNEIIWAYDFGGRAKRKWSAKHDNILWYAANPKDYIFNFGAMERIPYMAPGLVGKEKAARGKTPTDVWWHTIVPTNGKEKTGYPTQKPLGILERIIKVHSNPGDTVLDFFAGSGTTGFSAASNGRKFVLVDQNPSAIDVMRNRLQAFEPAYKVFGKGQENSLPTTEKEHD